MSSLRRIEAPIKPASASAGTRVGACAAQCWNWRAGSVVSGLQSEFLAAFSRHAAPYTRQ